MIMLLITGIVLGGVSLFFAIIDHVYTHKEFYENGVLKRKESFLKVKGSKVFHGATYIYFPDGNIESALTYKWGKLNGVQIYYRHDGSIERKELFENAVLITTITE